MAQASVTSLGTPYYMSSECLLSQPYNEKSDMFSLGVIFYELVELRKPYPGENVDEVIRSIVYGDYCPMQRPNVPLEIRQLIHDLLRRNPTRRPSAREVLQRPIMRAALETYVNRFV